MRFLRLVGMLVGAWLGTSAWAQPGHGPQDGAKEPDRAVERAPRVHRDELRALIRQQPLPLWEEGSPGAAPPHPHQLSPEERRNLRNQLRQQRGEDRRHPP